MMEIRERARRYIAKCPPSISGQGGHNAAFHVARVLTHDFALEGADAMSLFQDWNQTCQPPWSEAELRHKLESAAAATHRHPRGCLVGATRSGRTGAAHGPARQAPAPPAGGSGGEPVAATERFLKGFRCGEADLAHASPIRLPEDPSQDGALLVASLYLAGEQINVVTEFARHAEKSGAIKARPMGRGVTLEREALAAWLATGGPGNSEAGGWLRMNPLDGHGIADANVTALRFALLESDALPADAQLSLFARLPLPIAALISSGARSIHAWVKVDARDADDYRATVARMLGLLAKFGVDGKNKNPSRLSRLPGVRRMIGAGGDGWQRLLYLNPAPDEGPILA